MKHVSVNVLSAPDTASAAGIQVDSSELVCASFQAIFGDSTATGSINLQGSNDVTHAGNLPATFTATHWSQVATTAVTAGGTVIIPKTDLSYRWIRVVFTSTVAGSTTVNVNMFALSV